MSDIKLIVDELISKAKGYGSSSGGSGGVAEAASHNIQTTPPKGNEAQIETNKANSGTHPETGGKGRKNVSGGRPEGGTSFPDGGAEEDEISGVKGPSGRAPQGHPGALKHEGGGTGPNHPGTGTTTQPQQKSEGEPTLTKSDDGEDEEPDDDSDDKNDKKPTPDDANDGDDGGGEEKVEKEEKSSESSEVFLDIDEFASEITQKSVDQVIAYINEEFGPALSKSQEGEYVQAGLAKSLTAALDRIEELEKAITNVANIMNIRKSLLNSADIKSIKNKSLESVNMSKSEISSRLLDLQMKGEPGVDTNLVLRFDAVGDISMIPDMIKSKIGLDGEQ
jgi:hypothetical protein